ncbi:spore germination protein [Salipaludibacillus daqingensis]|uniref:spore germination protein n=1 Tax=Salipaludibacillus daqingensis TaxID=3041001 RepID=UPI002473AB3E|nr:spore germination protein [Salipaludibacillus daqingensis]
MINNIENKLKSIEVLFGETEDLVIRRFTLREDSHRRAAAIYLEGLVDTEVISQQMVRPLMNDTVQIKSLESLEQITDLITVSETKVVKTLEEMVALILTGDTCIVVDELEGGVIASSKGWEQRAVENPLIERTTRGPHEGFVESLQTNIGLIRSHVKHGNLIFEKYEIGTVSSNSVMIGFIKGKAKPTVVEEVRQRLTKIDIEAVLESGYVEQLIEDDPLSVFPSMKVTERPDIVSGNILEGKVCILVNGSPFVLIVPASINSMMQSSDDYYERYPQVILMRGVRWIALLIALLLPAFYVAGTTYNHEVIPTPLLFTIAATREGIPLPAVLEALLMEIAFEILREAGIRLPQPIGPAVSIVGVLVIGEAAVNAGIISNIMVVIVGMTALSTFAIPQYSFANAVRFLRFPMIILAGSLGLLGIGAGTIVLLTHLLTMRSFGNPMMDPFAPLAPDDLSDSVIRLPWKTSMLAPLEKLRKMF